MTFPGMQRVIRRSQGTRVGDQPERLSNIQAELPPLGDTPGNRVIHTFRARSVYCIQTIQWACGTPIGWGKCYNGESLPEVLEILNRTWDEHNDLRPSFLAYDKACDLLRHVVTQNPADSWLQSTRFIVDAWHYIGHRATDAICRLWCNPSPSDGSQPDLVVTQTDDDGNVHTTRAFNTETAEQFNSWLEGFEAQVRQMSDVTYDFYIHVLMMVYKDMMDEKIEHSELSLDEEFWDRVEGLGDGSQV